MAGMIEKIQDFFVKGIWSVDMESAGSFRAFLIKILRLLYVAAREFSEGHLTLRAMSLVYTTLLSLVPLLAVSFSVLKGFGVHNQIEPLLMNFLTPLGPKGEEITYKIIGFVENIKVGVLGTIGISLLIYTVISLILKIETSFNSIWRIRKPRSFARRFSDYMSVVLIGPVLMFTAMGLTASVTSATVVQKLITIEPFGMVFYFLSKLVPYIFVCVAFTFIYSFIPNTKVKFRSALLGGIFAGILWETSGWIFASFVVTSTKYAAIYSGFAILIMFMIWLYLSWLILLVGAKISFYHQYPHFLSVKKETLMLSNRLREKLSFLVMFLIGDNFHGDKPPWTLSDLVNRLDLPLEPVQDVLSGLKKNGLIIETGDDPPSYVPAKDIATITLREFFRSVRVAEEVSYSIESGLLSRPEVDGVISRVDSAIDTALGDETLKDIILINSETNEER
jgi:membrane protein